MKKLYLLILILIAVQGIWAQQSAQTIIEKYAQKIGGKKAWQALKSYHMELDGKAGENQFSSHQYMLKPNCFKMTFKYPKRLRVLSYDGISGYITNNEIPEEMSKGMETEMQEEAEFFDELILYKEKGYTTRLERDTIINHNDYYKISLYKNSKDTQWYYINKSSYLVEIVEEYSEEKKWNGTLFKTVFDNHRQVQDVKFPFKISLFANNDLLMEYSITRIELNPELSKADFKL